MTSNDLEFIHSLLDKGLIGTPVLELGGGYGGGTCKSAIEGSGRKYFATDLHAALGVDVVANFESGIGLDSLTNFGPFGTVLVLNVLEHTFNPIEVLDNAIKLIKSGGNVVTVTPAVWPIHSYPIDACRLLPDWYRKYAATRGLLFLENEFQFLSFGPIAKFVGPNGARFPFPAENQAIHRFWSRVIHKTFGTFGRGMQQPSHLAISAVFVRA